MQRLAMRAGWWQRFAFGCLLAVAGACTPLLAHALGRVAMLAGRVVYFLTAAALGRAAAATLAGLFVRPWPGMLLQIALLPALALLIRRSLSPVLPRAS